MSVEMTMPGAMFGGGSTLSRLLANDMDVGCLRTNDVLRYDEWKSFDDVILPAAMQRMPAVADLVSRGLTFEINGMEATVLQYENASEIADATMTMRARADALKDRPTFGLGYLPLPFTHMDFELDGRVLAMGRKMGQPLDTFQAELAAESVAEKIETTLLNGASTFTYGPTGSTIYGYTDHPSANTGSLTDAWDDTTSAGVGEMILNDTLTMIQANRAVRHYGPYGMYVPTAYERALDDDFKANSDLTVRQRLLQIDSLEFVKVADKLTADKVVVVELAPTTVRMVIGLNPTPVEWSIEGGLATHFKVMAIMVPQIRADKDGRCGVAVYTGS